MVEDIDEKNQAPELPATFNAEFQSKGSEIASAMADMGGYVIEGSGVGPDETFTYRGRRQDGTIVTISFKKGERYQSPAEIEVALNPETAAEAEGEAK